MSFRRDSERANDWCRWIRNHGERLLAIGIPREVWQDLSSWQRFLWHAYHSDPSDWRNFRFALHELSQDRQRMLYEFFVEHGFGPADCCGSMVWDRLRRPFAPSAEDE